MMKLSQDWVLKLLLAVPFNIGSFLYQPHPHVEKSMGKFSSPCSQGFPDCASIWTGVKKKSQDPSKVP